MDLLCKAVRAPPKLCPIPTGILLVLWGQVMSDKLSVGKNIFSFCQRCSGVGLLPLTGLWSHRNFLKFCSLFYQKLDFPFAYKKMLPQVKKLYQSCILFNSEAKVEFFYWTVMVKTFNSRSTFQLPLITWAKVQDEGAPSLVSLEFLNDIILF